MLRPFFASALPAALLLAALGHGASELDFTPREGLVLEKRGRWELQAEFRAQTRLNGQEQFPDEPSASYVSTGTIAAVDTYSKVEGGRAMRLERRFDQLVERSTPASGFEDESEEQTSPLQGATAVFTWNAESEDWSAAFAEGTGQGLDPLLLDDQPRSLDFEFLLPGKEVEPGDAWIAVPEAMPRILALGASSPIAAPSREGSAIDKAIHDGPLGTVLCTYCGTRAAGGRELAVIELELLGAAHAEEDSHELVLELVMADVHRSFDSRAELEGELLWDAEAGHFARLVLRGRTGFTFVETARRNDQERELECTLGGPLAIEYEASAP